MTTSGSSSPRQLADQRTDRLDTGRAHASQGQGLRLEERVTVLRDRLEAHADDRAAGQLRADVTEARAHVRDWHPDRAVSQSTASRYAHTVEQMRERGQRPEDAACKSSFEFRRAALVHETRKEVRTALRDLDKSKRSGNLGQAADAYNRVRSGLDTLRRYPPSTGSRDRDLERSSAFRGPSRPPEERSNGKRASLVGLPDDWRDKVQAQVRSHDRPAVAAMAITGCRPSEARGIKVRQDADTVTLEIRGAKVDDDRGIKTRSISIQKSELEQSQAGRDLADWLGNRECRTISHPGSTEAFRERVARAGDRAGLEQVSAYTYRHAEARDLKQAGTDRDEIAARLGHRSERSQSVYG